MHEAFIGYLWGNCLAILLALAFLVLPILERPLMRLGIASYCLPVIAIGPILQISFNGQTPEDHPRRAVGVLHDAGRHARGAAQRRHDRARRGPRVRRRHGSSKLTRCALRAALPSLFVALRIAAPAAVLGAIIGEYSAASRGSASR